jgi:quinol monooxygenase YgiN
MRDLNKDEEEKEMAEKRVTVVARIKAQEGMEEKVKQELLALIAPSRSEEACLKYDLHQSLDDKMLFMFYETWTGREALDKHLLMPYLDAFDENTEGMLAEPVEVTLWEMIS